MINLCSRANTYSFTQCYAPGRILCIVSVAELSLGTCVHVSLFFSVSTSLSLHMQDFPEKNQTQHTDWQIVNHDRLEIFVGVKSMVLS